MSLLEFETISEQLGYSKEVSIWCWVCGEKKINPKLIKSDQDLMSMIDKIPKRNRVLECFMDHSSNEVQMNNAKATTEVTEEVVVEDVDHNSKAGTEFIEEDDATDFYDPNNDVEADDNDHVIDKNVTSEFERHWIVPIEAQAQLAAVEEDSDYAPSDLLVSGGESDDDGTSQKYPEFHAVVDMANPQFQIGMVFGSFEEFKAALKEYAIKQRRNIHFEKNDTTRVKAACKKGCPWKIWISRMGNGTENVQVKTYFPSHTCSNEHNVKFLTVKWLVKKYLGTFWADPKWSLEIIYTWRYQLKKPGMNGVFKRAYICLAAYREGFLAGCRRIISLDGCFLKTRYEGQLLSAIAIDANDCIFPIAYAVVEGETSESWRWFLQLLGNDLVMENSRSWTFMSDRQKGLVPMVQALFPAAEHRFCVRHMYDNFSNAGHKGKLLKDQLWSAAIATYVAGHEKCMMELQVLSKAAFEWLKRKPPTEWTKSHFPTNSKCGMLLNNLCECFNKYILDARDKPIITMLEFIRTKLMRRLQVKRDEMLKYKGPICPKIQKKLDKWKEEAIKFNAVWNGAAQYQVTGVEGQFVVNIATFSCDCRRWDLTGIPCEHACASMRVNGLVPEEYVHDCYKVTKKKTSLNESNTSLA
ncbi:hypothetical protein LUZ63_002890 [Rhynchospora breviuscula]|uniref:SWIM-type domain-containing protein n=1 Tax=Rhynchospora breviuscula TaxID=2022672 RepID=A0A9Q0CZL3_9POAL|nr:hypothetical protein LUZ63_002890 [Rhynchospora breviuscula]